MREIIKVILFLLMFEGIALAEIYKCDGKWTNRPCTGKIEAQVAESPGDSIDEMLDNAVKEKNQTKEEKGESGAVSSQAEPMTKRYEMVRKLRKTNDSYQNQKKKTLERKQVEAVASICNDSRKSAEDCNKANDDALKELEKLNSSAEDAFLGKIE